MTARLLAAAAGIAALALGCAPTAAFSGHHADNQRDALRGVLARAPRAPSAPRGAGPRAYLVTAGPAAARAIVAWDLAAGRALWEQRAEVTSRLVVGPGVVYHRQGLDRLVARDAQGGAILFQLTLGAGERLLGMAADDSTLFVVAQGAGGGRRHSRVAAYGARTGQPRWSCEAEGSAGAPAAANGLLFVPYLSQYLVVLDGADGRELTRVRQKDGEINFVRALPEGLTYGGRGVGLLGERSATGERAGAAWIEPRLPSEFVRAFYHWDAYSPVQVDYSAFDRNRLLWRLAPGGGAALRDGQVVLHNYRFLFGLDAATARVRWAYANPRQDLVGSEDVGATVLAAAADGALLALSARDGRLLSRATVGRAIAGATFDAEGFTPAASAAAAEPLWKTLGRIAWDGDSRFTAVKVFAVDALGHEPGAEVTAELLKLVTAPTTPRPVGDRAGEMLVERRDAAAGPLLVAALTGRSDYLEGRRPRAVGVIARAAASIGAKEATPALVAHLGDAATPLGATKEIAAALGALALPEARAALRDFLFMYRADPMFIADPAPLVVACEALLRTGDAHDRGLLAYLAQEARTLEALRLYLAKALAETSAGGARTGGAGR